jgi:hypothetical protein
VLSVTDRHAEVFARLGSEQVTDRVATIWELDTLLSEQDGGHDAIVDRLVEFVRGNVTHPWLSRMEPMTLRKRGAVRLAPDVQAALSVVSRRAGEQRLDLRGADLSEARFAHARLAESDLHDAHLGGADLFRANLGWAFLARANLADANLTYATMNSSTLRDANLRGARLSHAYLRGADLTGADCDGAELQYADVAGVTIRWARRAFGSIRASPARIARSGQDRRGLGLFRRSTATSWRKASISASFDADDRASRASQDSTWTESR